MKTSTIETITPEIAKRYLLANTRNRRMRKTGIEKYARDMKAGRWMLTTDAIGFDTNGALTNGQHRLEACVETGIPFEAIVVRGLDPESFDATDNGMNRTLADVLRGQPCATAVSACIKTAFLLRNGRNGFSDMSMKTAGLSNKMGVEEFEKNPDGYIDAAAFANHARKTGMNNITEGRLAGLFYFLIYDKGHDRDKVENFFTQILSFKTAEDPNCELLRMRLVKERGQEVKMTARLRLNLVAKAWNFYLTGKRTQVLKWMPDVEGDIVFM
jgi:hypothetical protein